MTSMQKSVIDLIYAAITKTKIELPQDFSISKAAEIAKKHQIIPIIYYGALQCGIPNDDTVMQELFNWTCICVSLNVKQTYELKSIFDEFDKNKIDYMPLKGTLLKEKYPRPEMRLMSDADILIKTQQYGLIKPIMSSLGYTEVTESDHEFVWKKNKVNIELHKRLIPSYNKDYYDYFGEGWKCASICDGTRYSMTDEDELIYLFTHFSKHYRDAGIGIKHLLDLWIFLRDQPSLNKEYIKQELTDLQLFEFYCNIINTIDCWFNGKEPDEKTEHITNTIFDSGVYGTANAHILSAGLKDSRKVKNVKLHKYLTLIFLPYKNMCVLYPFLRKLPFLLPFMWLYRIIVAIIFKQNAIKSHSNKASILTADKIKTYQDMLNFVGLDFNFKE